MLTEELIKEQLSIAFVHAIAAKAGFSVDKPGVDTDSIDLVVSAKGQLDATSKLRSPRIELQLKASSRFEVNEGKIAFQLPKKNYDDLRGETALPRVLVLFHLPEDSGEWLIADTDKIVGKKAAYFVSIRGFPEIDTESKVVHVPVINHLTVDSLKQLMLKASKMEELA